MRLSRQFIHAILAFVLLVACFAYFFKSYKIPIIQVSKIDSTELTMQDTIIKNLYLSFANAFTLDIVKKTDESNLKQKSLNNEEVSPSAHYPLIIVERIFAFILISGIIIGRINTKKDDEKPNNSNDKIQYDVCYCIIINYTAYFKYRYKKNIEIAFAKKGFLFPVFDFLMHCLECFNLGALIRFVSYKSGLKNVLIDLFIILKITFVLCCLQGIFNFNSIQYIIWYILLTNMFTYIYHDIWLECF